MKSLFQEEDRFILLDDFDTNAVNIFRYDPEFDNFFDYQTLFHDSRIDGIECFYAHGKIGALILNLQKYRAYDLSRWIF